MKELFYQSSNLFNFGKERRLVNQEAKNTAETTKKTVDAAKNIPSANDAPGQVDRDVSTKVNEGNVVDKKGRNVLKMAAIKVAPAKSFQIHNERMHSDPTYAKIYNQFNKKWSTKRGENVAWHMAMAVADGMNKGASSVAARRKVHKVIGQSTGLEAYNKLFKARLISETRVANVPSSAKPTREKNRGTLTSQAAKTTEALKGTSEAIRLAGLLLIEDVPGHNSTGTMKGLISQIPGGAKILGAIKSMATQLAGTDIKKFNSYKRAFLRAGSNYTDDRISKGKNEADKSLQKRLDRLNKQYA